MHPHASRQQRTKQYRETGLAGPTTREATSLLNCPESKEMSRTRARTRPDSIAEPRHHSSNIPPLQTGAAQPVAFQRVHHEGTERTHPGPGQWCSRGGPHGARGGRRVSGVADVRSGLLGGSLRAVFL